MPELANTPGTRPAVLVLAGLDPSGGAGLAADITAIGACGAHALPVVTVLTVQDHNRVHAIEPVSAQWLCQQADALIAAMPVAAIKIGIIGSAANALAIADIIRRLRAIRPDLPVVLDPVLASGHGDALATDDPVRIIAPLLPLTSVILPNQPEAVRLCQGEQDPLRQAHALLAAGCGAVLLKGGHATGERAENHYFTTDSHQSWHWPRLPGAFHGSGCTLAASLAANLALRRTDALWRAQAYTHHALAHAYALAPGQSMPARSALWQQET